MMISWAVFVVFCTMQLLVVENLTAANAINPVISPGNGPGSCATADSRQDAIASIENAVITNIANIVSVSKKCGAGLWYSVASLDMTDPRQQCPTGWREYNESSVRACGRPESESLSCASVSYSTGRQYSKVCGRIIGYQVSTPDGFRDADRTIDENYVDGISITYGKNPRQHIWTYAAGVTENSTVHAINNCPCWDPSADQPQGFVGDRYYCESGNVDAENINGGLYGNDKLWDGQQCSNEGTCCTTMSPPWFSVDLANPTIDDIEIRICGDESTDNEDTPIELLDIYIQ